MKIVIINHHTGVEKYGSNSRHFAIAEHLSKLGHEIILIGSSFNHKSNKYIHQDDFREEKVNDFFTYISIKSSPSYNNNLKRLINYFDFTRKTLNFTPSFIPDVIIGSSVHPFVWISGWKLARKYNCQFHIEIRDIWPMSMYEDLPPFIRDIVMKFSRVYENFYYKKARGIIVTAPQANKYLNKYFKIGNKKINYVPHGINIKKFDMKIKDRNDTLFTKNFSKDKTNISYAGSLSSSEGLENFIALADKFKNNKHLHFHIVGSGNQEEKLKNIVKSKELKNITFYGHINNDLIPLILINSDILWCGLKSREVFKYSISKNKFYDYMASSKPIIFHSDVKGSPLEESKSSFIVGLNKLPINELNKLIKNKELRIKMGENGRNYVEKNHDISIISQKYIRDFKK